MNLYQLYANPTELKWYDEANVKIPEVFASEPIVSLIIIKVIVIVIRRNK